MEQARQQTVDLLMARVSVMNDLQIQMEEEASLSEKMSLED